MTGLGTIRERIERASRYFQNLEGVVLTTFNLAGAFLEEQALPVALGVEGKTVAARRAELHQRLAATPCTVLYDPTGAPQISGRYRYVARPVPLRGRLFHPKLVVMAGRSNDETTWVYLAVSSANLTLSGWGRNAECFGETWIHTRRQQSWQALDGLLAWLQDYAPLGEDRTGSDAVQRVRAALERMPDRRRFADHGTEPWSGSLHARFYSSVVHSDGFPAFMRMNKARPPSGLCVYSPFWGEVSEQVAAFGAQETCLVPALRADCAALALTREQAQNLDETTTVRRNPYDLGTRFWHMKAYRMVHGDTAYTAVGSCNFTPMGLAGGHGNVEAMLLFKEDEPEWPPEGAVADLEALADDGERRDDAPEPIPVAIVVGWDWHNGTWRWWLEPARGQHDFVLHLPGLAAFSVKAGTNAKAGKPPPRGATFCVTYETAQGTREWNGQVVELNLDHSSRNYGRPLTASEILESWLGRAPSWDAGSRSSGGLGIETDDDSDEEEASVATRFEAVNLYELYRSMQALRTKLDGLNPYPEIQRSYLVGRPDSVMALALLAEQDQEAPVIRYLVLRELCLVMHEWSHLIEGDLRKRIDQMAQRARLTIQVQLQGEVSLDQADDMLDWVEKELAGLDGRSEA